MRIGQQHDAACDGLADLLLQRGSQHLQQEIELRRGLLGQPDPVAVAGEQRNQAGVQEDRIDIGRCDVKGQPSAERDRAGCLRGTGGRQITEMGAAEPVPERRELRKRTHLRVGQQALREAAHETHGAGVEGRPGGHAGVEGCLREVRSRRHGL